MSTADYYMKKVLKKLHLFNFVKKIVGRKEHKATSDRVGTILAEETSFSFDKIESIDAFVGSLKIRIHGVEKNLVKGGRKYELLERQCFGILDDMDTFLSKFNSYPVDSDIVKEVIGICKLVMVESEGKFDCSRLVSEVDIFCRKHGLDITKGHDINILSKNPNDLYWIDSSKYEDFVMTRFSVRETTNEIISVEEIKEIVSIAQQCPSACNRQSTKVYYLVDSEQMRLLFPDPAVTKDIHNLLIVTVNKSYYSTAEVLQAWIDGGIFLESMVMALHSHHLGACLFQCMKNTKRYTDVKKVVNIPDNEDIVAFIGYGKLKNEYKVISKHRKEINEVLVPVKIVGGGDTL